MNSRPIPTFSACEIEERGMGLGIQVALIARPLSLSLTYLVLLVERTVHWSPPEYHHLLLYVQYHHHQKQ